jgi:hypothetical protein
MSAVDIKNWMACAANFYHNFFHLEAGLIFEVGEAGLPDGLFSNQTFLVHFGRPFKISYDHLVYFWAIGFILWQFGIFCGLLLYVLSQFWYVVSRKILQPLDFL